MAIVIITILSTVIGLVLNAIYDNKYASPAIHWGGFAVQCVFMFLALLTLPNPDVTGWFLLWVVCALVAYTIGIVLCRQQAILAGAEKGDVIKAIIAQVVLPFGVAIVAIIVVGIFLGAFSKKKS